MKNIIKRALSVAVILIMLLSMGIVNAVPVTAADNEISATDSKVRYTGHWAKSGSDMKGYFQSTLEIRFTGMSLKVKSNKKLAVQIDNGDWTEVGSKSGIVEAASGLADGNHKAVIMLPLPLSYGDTKTTVISGFIIDQGAKLLPPDDTKAIAFIGDSITMGHFGQSNYDPDNLFEDSIINTYVVQVAKTLGMIPNATAIGGIGIETSNNTQTIDALGMTERYFKLGEFFSDAKNIALDTKLYTPEYIVIALGSNGKYTEASALSTQKIYEDFLKKLRSAYPDSYIFCLTPFQSAGIADLELKKTNIIYTSVLSRKEDGDKKVFYLDCSEYIVNTAQLKQDPTGQTTDGVHPTYAGHDLIAQKLSTAITAEIMKMNYKPSGNKNYGSYTRPSRISSTDKTESQEQETAVSSGNKTETSSKKSQTNINSNGVKKENNTEKQNSKTNSKTKKESTADNKSNSTKGQSAEYASEEVFNEEIIEKTQDEPSGIMRYLWLLILVAAVVVIALLVVIFLPQIKTLFKK